MNIMRTTKVKSIVGIAGTFVVSVGLFGSSLTGVARADYAPAGYTIASGQGDIVGVGSDTLQFLADFGADGDYSGASGFNFGQPSKIISMDATADSNARLAYNNVGPGPTSTVQNPTVVLRSGAFPAQRPNGSGAGIAALLQDVTATTTPAATGLPEFINFARASRLPKVAENTTAVNNGWGGLRTVRIATETLGVAVATVTHAPVGLTTTQLKSIYNCTIRSWNDPSLGGTGVTTTSLIIPIIPQPGSGTRATFLTDIAVADPAGLGSCVVTSEENDPVAISTAVSGTSTSADAIGPMSSARLALFNGTNNAGTPVVGPGVGYFHDPNAAFSKSPNPFPGGAVINPGIKFVTGQATGTTGPDPRSYADQRGLFIAFRNSDVANLNGRGWQPGSTQSWIQTLFLNPAGTPFFADPIFGQPLLANAGGTPAYADCGTAPYAAVCNPVVIP